MKVDNMTVARNLYLVLLFDGGNYLSIVVMVSSSLLSVSFEGKIVHLRATLVGR